ncbi:hypothetical protein HY837_05050 [archaeon]|nr:hypothetical protein [archaeon]
MINKLTVKDKGDYFLAEWFSILDLEDAFNLAYECGKNLDVVLSTLDEPTKGRILAHQKLIRGIAVFDLDPNNAPHIDPDQKGLESYVSWQIIEKRFFQTQLGGFRIGFDSCDIIYRTPELLNAYGFVGKSYSSGEFRFQSYLDVGDEVRDLASKTNPCCDVAELAKLGQIRLIHR